MNSKLDFIFGRRSVRTYDASRAVTDDMVRDLLEAAMAAPSACAKDPWHFIVVRDAALKARIAEGLPNGKMLAHAAAGLVVCGDLKRAHDGQESYLLQDCAAAIENILLAAHALHLGAVWLGVHPRPDRMAHIRAIFGLPEHIVPVSAIAVGWPAQHPPARTRYRDEAVHREVW